MKTSDVNMQRVLHKERKTESWIVSYSPPNEQTIATLVGAHVNIHDYYGSRPILLFALPKPPKQGKVFKDVYFLQPNQIPKKNVHLLVNGIFLRESLETELKTSADESVALHNFDALELLLNAKDSTKKIEHLQYCSKLLVMGVCGTNLIHLSRGL